MLARYSASVSDNEASAWSRALVTHEQTSGYRPNGPTVSEVRVALCPTRNDLPRNADVVLHFYDSALILDTFPEELPVQQLRELVAINAQAFSRDRMLYSTLCGYLSAKSFGFQEVRASKVDRFRGSRFRKHPPAMILSSLSLVSREPAEHFVCSIWIV